MRFNARIPKIEWRDVTPPGATYELHAAPDPDNHQVVVYRCRLRSAGLNSEPRANHMTRGAWTEGVPREHSRRKDRR